MRRFSKPVLSGDEAAEKIRRDNAGQPAEWIDDAIAAELAARTAREAELQAKYDNTPPARPYTPPDEA